MEGSASSSLTRRHLLLTAAGIGLGACTSDDGPPAERGGPSPRFGEPSASSSSDAGNDVDVVEDGVGIGGLGTAVPIGALAEILERIDDGGGFAYYPEARAWITRYPAEHVERAREVYDRSIHEGLAVGLIALWQRCPHLGCRVPECRSSGFFECPCHVSRFSSVGEHRGGPAPRGMDLFPVRLVGPSVMIETGSPVLGLAPDVDITGQLPAGPFCVADASTSS